MPIPDAIKTNFYTLEKAFKNRTVVLLECRKRSNGEPAYAICAINLLRQTDREPEIEMVPFGLMFNEDPYETLIPASNPEFDQLDQSMSKQKVSGAETGGAEIKRA